MQMPMGPAHALARQKLLTLAFGDMETVKMLPTTYAELLMMSKDWTRPPPDAMFTLRVPTEYVSFQAARLVAGPYIYLTDEESFQIATMGVQGLRVEIVSDAPPPPDEVAAPPPPVLEMPATFSLEMEPGTALVLETMVSDEFDMARMDDGTIVDGTFWGKLDIVHSGDTHKMDFSGTRLEVHGLSPDFMVDARTISKLVVASKPAVAKCQLSVLCPAQQTCEIVLTFSPMWKIGLTWPPAEQLSENKIKYFIRANPGGALEHFNSEVATTALYYEAIPDPNMVDPNEYISPKNGFGLSFQDFIPHLSNVLDQLGMSLHAKSTFINNNMSAFACHRHVAYRFLAPRRIASAIDISVTSDPCLFTRLFLMFRGVTDDEMDNFVNAGEKEANQMNWREVVGWNEESKDPTQFRILETTVLEVT
ncbi:hypothetical protein BDV98DRAFT_552063 [Pterulicium gracile]|uniref:Uncharacterized protein n=1 Tax=Pterulicium gracile TaxID=1884261 RepID=A0A5C3QAB0_9AGAR|nr:hypothetical protein BDV98DRAFT_552063 [Pterula gracilis]